MSSPYPIDLPPPTLIPVVEHPTATIRKDIALRMAAEAADIREALFAQTSEVANEDEDIAIRVDYHRVITELWLRPGILSRKSPNQIAREIVELSAHEDSQLDEQSAAVIAANYRGLSDEDRKELTEVRPMPGMP